MNDVEVKERAVHRPFRLQRVILKQLAEQPPAIICDLSRVEAKHAIPAGELARR